MNKPAADLELDALRCIALACMVLAHVHPPRDILALRNFDVPLIVLVSGASYALSSSKSLGLAAYLRKRVLRLALPGWIFLTVLFALWAAFCGAPPLRTLLGAYTFWRGVSYMWILRVFMGMSLLAPLLQKAHASLSLGRYLGSLALLYALYECLLASTQGLAESEFKLFLQQGLLELLPYACIFGLGLCLRDFKGSQLLMLSGIGFAIYAFLAWHDADALALVSAKSLKFPPRPIYLSYALGVSFALCRAFRGLALPQAWHNPLTWFSRSSLWIYLWHILFLSDWCWFPARMEGHWALQWFLALSLATLITWSIEGLVLRAFSREGWLLSLFCPGVCMAVLSLENITLRFGGLSAISNFSLSLGQGELAGLIGPNGAGKTSVFNVLSGIYMPQEGRVEALGRPILGLKPHQITSLGLTRTFQNIRLFKSLSVADNIKVAFSHERPYGLLSALLRRKDAVAAEQRFESRAKHLMELLELSPRQGLAAGSLPYGDQKKLEIARAVATGAKILLLDEPAAGMNPQESAWLMQAIQRVQKEFSLSLLLIEHDMKVVMGICEKIHVLDHGLKIAEGTPYEIQKNPRVIEAYLGTKHS